MIHKKNQYGLKESMIIIFGFINNSYFSKEQISLIGIKTTFTLKKKTYREN